MRGGVLWLLIVSLPVAMLIAAGTLAIQLALCARALPGSPFPELAEVAIESVLVTGSLAGVREPLLEQSREVMLWVVPLGTISCLIAGLAGGAMSRDANRAWFALTPLLMLPVVLFRLDAWSVGVAVLWMVAAVLGANVVRRTVSPTGGSG
jgi:hypothetical protein